MSKGKGGGTARPRYKHHRAVDDRCGVITAVETTPGDVPEAERLLPVIAQHEANTRQEATHVVADRGYGIVEQYCRSGGGRHEPVTQKRRAPTSAWLASA